MNGVSLFTLLVGQWPWCYFKMCHLLVYHILSATTLNVLRLLISKMTLSNLALSSPWLSCPASRKERPWKVNKDQNGRHKKSNRHNPHWETYSLELKCYLLSQEIVWSNFSWKLSSKKSFIQPVLTHIYSLHNFRETKQLFNSQGLLLKMSGSVLKGSDSFLMLHMQPGGKRRETALIGIRCNFGNCCGSWWLTIRKGRLSTYRARAHHREAVWYKNIAWPLRMKIIEADQLLQLLSGEA